MCRWRSIYPGMLLYASLVVVLPAWAASTLPVVATFSILGDVVQQVGGDTITLHTLVGADGDTHTFEPSPRDSITLSQAALIFEIGLALETWLDKLYDASGSTAKRVVVSTGLPLLPAAEAPANNAADQATVEQPIRSTIRVGGMAGPKPWVFAWVKPPFEQLAIYSDRRFGLFTFSKYYRVSTLSSGRPRNTATTWGICGTVGRRQAMSWLLEPLHSGFMQHGLVAAVLVGITCAVLGVYVVLRRMAFLGDALAHSILPGLVVAYLNSWNLFAGAIVARLVTVIGIGYLSQRDTLHEDTAIGILFTGMFALGILLMSTTRSFRDLSHMLFGNLIGVTTADLALIATIAVLVVGLLLLFHKDLELTSVDPTYAAVIGRQADKVRYGLMTLLALTMAVGIQVVGVVLTSALLVTPAATALLLTNRLPRMVLLAMLIAVGSSITGLYSLLLSQRLLRSGDRADVYRLFRLRLAGANRYPLFSELKRSLM